MDDSTPIKTLKNYFRGPPWFSHISWFFYLLEYFRIIGKSWVYKSAHNIQDNIGSNYRSWQFKRDIRKFQGASQELSNTSATIFPFFLDRRISTDWLGIDSPWLKKILSINALKCSRMKNFYDFRVLTWPRTMKPFRFAALTKEIKRISTRPSDMPQ